MAAIMTLLAQHRGFSRPPQRARRPAAREHQLPLNGVPADHGLRIATLTLAPASDRLDGDDPRWRDELHSLYVGLRRHVGAVPLLRGAGHSAPREPREPVVLVVLFSYSSTTVTNLSVCPGPRRLPATSSRRPGCRW